MKTEHPATWFEWVREIGETELECMSNLFKAALEVDDLIGFSRIAPEAGSGYFKGLQFDINTGRKRLLVSRTSEKIVGMVLLTPNALPNCGHIAEVSKCIIHPMWRAKGILNAGLAELVAHCQVTNIEVLVLDVRKGTRVETLWRALGFSSFGELPDYSRAGGVTYAGVYLWAPVSRLSVLGHSK